MEGFFTIEQDPPAGTGAPPGENVLADPVHQAMARPTRRRALAFLAFGALLVGGALVSVGAGAVAIAPGQVMAILAARVGVTLPWDYDTQQALVLMGIRLPRVLLCIVVGAGLSVSGALMQGLFRNPLADPGLVGVSSGATLGAALMIVLGAGLPAFLASPFGPFAVVGAAFVFGLGTTLLVYRIATNRQQTSVATMLLAGIAVNALCGAGTGSLVLLTNENQLRDLTFWTLGSMGGATWPTLGVVAPLILGAVAAAPGLARALNAMLLGEAEAQHLGIRTQRVKRQVIVLAALSVGAATAVCGLIGFVGLVVPHLVRLLLGPDHRTLLPASALLGAGLLLLADLFARLLLQPVEIPIGIVTAFAGAPFFLWLLLRQRSEHELSF